MTGTVTKPDAERIYHDWDEALGRKDVDAAMTLYARDCVFESPLVCHLIKSERGVVEGRDKLREFVSLVFARTPTVRQRYRKGFFTDGRKLIWEYPRATPSGEQMDFMESMEINDDGLIQRHCVYWGWYGVGVLRRDAYHQ
jgi:SnoaL-like domain